MIRIAVIDDNEDNRLLLQALLSDRYEIVEFESGPAALAAWESPGSETEPALVLLDISLPDMDGPAILKRLKTIPHLARIPVVALTAHAMSGDRDKFLAMGFDDYVTKPIVDESILLGTIEKLLAR